MSIDSAMYCCNPSVGGGGAKCQLTGRCIVATLEWGGKFQLTVLCIVATMVWGGGKVSIDSAMYCCNPGVGGAKCQLTVRCIVATLE